MRADLLREKFLEFFKGKKHKIVESDFLVPKDDPTVLFTPAGMNQFKKQFMGETSGFTRAATSQRCLRTDDLDKVGKTTGHHTFFEMLGNFSFGDYFKKEAIAWAWEFLIEELKIDQEKLWVSVYKDDDEAYVLWRDMIKVPTKKIIKLGDKDNFWPAEAKQKGPNGPCGPCSEIFYDFGKEKGCGKADCDPSCSCGRFVEIWNLVFTQFNRKEGGILEHLPQKNIDTGMGLERLAAVMQGVENNFQTDLFKPLTKEIASHSAKRAANENELINAIADHIRAITFSIYDGVLPSNDGRGYVVRKIIRKSVLNLRALGIEKPFLYRLVPVLAEIMKAPYPELQGRRENISEIILAEEKNFNAILNSSTTLLEEKFLGFSKNQDPEKVGMLSFQLYDTHGIPLELTSDWLNKHKIKFYQLGFDQELEKQKNRSKSASAMKGDVFASTSLKIDAKTTKFVGYGKYTVKSEILAILTKDGKEAKKIKKGEEARIIVDQTVFYAESGGQVGDTGELIKGKNVFEVIDTQKNGRVIVHIGKVKDGSFKKGDAVTLSIDAQRRLAIARNHTATHLLQAALRKILGPHVQQQGSLVSQDRLRFDFTHFKDLSDEEIERIELEVNSSIMDNVGLSTAQLSLQEAKKKGALAFFAEKYDAKVRVVTISDVSKELCAGTHLAATGQIGYFKIIHEGSVASGVRRIEAVTGMNALKAIKEEESIIKDVSQLLNVPDDKIKAELDKRLKNNKELEKQLASQKINSARSSIDDIIKDAEVINDIKFISKNMGNVDMPLLRSTVDMIKQKSATSIIILGAASDSDAKLVIGLTPDLCEKGLDASKLIQKAAREIGGSGGGRKDFAQAGGKNPSGLLSAFAKLKENLRI